MDGAFEARMRAIRSDRVPNFFFLNYDGLNWRVRDLLLVPHFAFPPSAINKRKPLSYTARRAGWVGCNIDLNRIPPDARIAAVKNGEVVPEDEVRKKFKRVKPLKDISIAERGWTLDVLNLVRRISLTRPAGHPLPSDGRGAGGEGATFTNGDIYAHARELEKLHPDNRHVRDKIRQQLQVLRDAKLLIHVSTGVWRLP